MDNLVSLLSKTSAKMTQYIKKELEKKGYNDIYVSHGSILINFLDKETMNYKELSRRINKSPQTMTTLIRKLEKEGFLSLEKDPLDKRNKNVRLTDKGRDFIPVLLDISQEVFDKQYIGINEEEQTLLKNILGKVLRNFEV